MERAHPALTRRELIAASAAGAALAALPAGAATPEKVPTVILGKTGRRVSRISCGGSWDIEPSVLAAAFDRGVNYLDTAEGYSSGQSERAMGEFLKERFGVAGGRKDVFVVTKTHQHNALEWRLEGSLKRLQLDYVDALFMHGIEDPAVMQDAEIKAAAERLKKAGKIRFFGFSCHAPRLTECVDAAASAGHLDLIMFKYNHHSREDAALSRAIDKCVKANLGLVAMKTVEGVLATIPPKYDSFLKRGLNKPQTAMKAIWADERIHVINSEMTTHAQVAENTAAAMSKLTLAEADALREYAALTSRLYCRGCEQHCANAAGSSVRVSDVLRFQRYSELYGKPARARELYAQLPPEARDLAAGDWEKGEAACPHGLPLRRMLAAAHRALG